MARVSGATDVDDLPNPRGLGGSLDQDLGTVGVRDRLGRDDRRPGPSQVLAGRAGVVEGRWTKQLSTTFFPVPPVAPKTVIFMLGQWQTGGKFAARPRSTAPATRGDACRCSTRVEPRAGGATHRGPRTEVARAADATGALRACVRRMSIASLTQEAAPMAAWLAAARRFATRLARSASAPSPAPPASPAPPRSAATPQPRPNRSAYPSCAPTSAEPGPRPRAAPPWRDRRVASAPDPAGCP